MKHLLVVGIFLISLISQAQDKKSIKTIHIEPYKHLANQAFFKSMVLRSPEEPVEYLSELNFEWGYRYTVKVERTDLQNPPADASSIEYRLIEVIEKKRVSDDYTFRMRLENDQMQNPEGFKGNLIKTGEYEYTFMGEIAIVYTTDQQSIFDRIIVDHKTPMCTFKFTKEGKLQLVTP